MMESGTRLEFAVLFLAFCQLEFSPFIHLRVLIISDNEGNFQKAKNPELLKRF